jgi:type II secretory pathway predicted ATPase ExeA
VSWIRELKWSHNPFDAAVQSEKDIFESQDLRRLQDAITEAVHQRQMLVVIGPPGAGKTTTTYDYLHEAPLISSRKVLVIKDLTTNIEQMTVAQIEEGVLRAVLQATESTESVKQSAISRGHQLQRVLGQYAKNHEVVLVLEDGHKMKKQTLINLKRLREMRFAMQERLLTVVILAQPSMRMLLEDLPEVNMRSRICEMQGLSSEEVSEYLQFKAKLAGGDIKTVVMDEAMKLIRKSFFWPLRLNDLMNKVLPEACELGMLPVPKDLIEKHAGAESNLRALMILSGLNLTEIQQECRRLKKDISRHTLRNLVEGRTKNPKLEETVRDILIGRTGAVASLYSTLAPGLTKDQREACERISELMMELGDDLDFADAARRTRLSQQRVFEITQGKDLTSRELQLVETAFREMKKKERQVKVA